MDRFWSKVKKTRGCWVWTGAKQSAGYGNLLIRLHKNKKWYLAHRYSWLIHNGRIPAGKQILHKCDVKLCVNPVHLYVGTASDNMRDACERGQIKYGDDRKTAKLTTTQVLEIRRSLKPIKEIASIYKVSRANIEFILNRKTWNHLPRI